MAGQGPGLRQGGGQPTLLLLAVLLLQPVGGVDDATAGVDPSVDRW